LSTGKIKASRDIIIGARAALKLTQEDLARATGLNPATINSFERGKTFSEKTRAAIQEALEARGVVFMNGDRPGFYLDRTRAVIPS
jgi:transcriptional regulator with XRE-family HTH domain